MLVRSDLPLADQAVQAGHACLQAGAQFGPRAGDSNLVLLAVEDQPHLLQALERIEAAGVRYVLFHEPDDGMGYSAACTEPVVGAQRRLFRRYRLWAEGNEPSFARAPPRP